VQEAIEAGMRLQANGFQFDAAYSSRPQQAIITLATLLDQIGQSEISRHTDWRIMNFTTVLCKDSTRQMQPLA
jgi:bisphosphoglycerate-dependent phosphoglycerate mutase